MGLGRILLQQPVAVKHEARLCPGALEASRDRGADLGRSVPSGAAPQTRARTQREAARGLPIALAMGPIGIQQPA